MRVADFHCDLLSYLVEKEGRTLFDPESQVSLPLLEKGGVIEQTFPIFTETSSDSVLLGIKQFEIFTHLPKMALTAYLAIENSSSFCLEKEPLEQGLLRLESWWKRHPIVYLSLTWNEENRFGGGANTKVGLKEDGRVLLQWMSGKKIAVDLSHASDSLAEEILKEIETLHVTPIASHSNFRTVCSHLRNLPDHLAEAIAGRGGIIGLNLVRYFLGSDGPEDLLKHIRHAQKLGIADQLCLGADFFSEIDVAPERAFLKPFFYEGFSTPACYSKLYQILRAAFSEEFIENLMFRRLKRFLESR